MHDVIESRAFRERGIFNVVGVRGLYAQHLAGRHDFSELLWLVLTYEMWACIYVDGRQSDNVPFRIRAGSA
jgi:asparagine synthase (glutamine-hydrolysing)